MGSSESKRSSLSLTQARTWQGPFAPRALLRFHATMNPADSRPEPNEKLCIPSRRCARKRTRSGLPGSWLFVRHAPPPNTPESTSGASARCFPDADRLHHRWPVGRSHLVNEAESGSIACGSRLRLSRPRPTDCSVARSIGYLMNEQFQGKLLSACANNQAFPGAPTNLNESTKHPDRRGANHGLQKIHHGYPGAAEPQAYNHGWHG
jgi:hypothetical protein